MSRAEENTNPFTVSECPECGVLGEAINDSWGNHVYQFHPDLVEEHINENPWAFREAILKRSKTNNWSGCDG